MLDLFNKLGQWPLLFAFSDVIYRNFMCKWWCAYQIHYFLSIITAIFGPDDCRVMIFHKGLPIYGAFLLQLNHIFFGKFFNE